MSDFWTESFEVADALERERQEADLRDTENEQRRDREILLEDPPPRKKAA